MIIFYTNISFLTWRLKYRIFMDLLTWFWWNCKGNLVLVTITFKILISCKTRNQMRDMLLSVVPIIIGALWTTVKTLKWNSKKCSLKERLGRLGYHKCRMYWIICWRYYCKIKWDKKKMEISRVGIFRN